MATVVALAGFVLNARVCGETAENYAHVPAVYRPHTSVCGAPVCGDGHVCGGLAGTLFGAPTVTVQTAQSRSVTGIPSAQAFGVPKVALRFGPGWVPSAQAFGAPTIKTTVASSVGGVGSAQSFGVVTPQAVFVRAVTGLGTAQAFGSVTTKAVRVLAVSGVSTAQGFGTLYFRLGRPTGGVPSAQQFGVPAVQAVYRVTPNGVTTAQQFGAIVARTGFTKPVPGLGSAQAFGQIKAIYLVTVPGVSSAQQFGTIRIALTARVAGVASAQAFGVVAASLVWLHPSVCTTVTLGSVVCLTTADPPICGDPICGDGSICGGTTAWLSTVECLVSEHSVLNEFLCGDGHKVGGGFINAASTQELVLAAPAAYSFDLEPAGVT